MRSLKIGFAVTLGLSLFFAFIACDKNATPEASGASSTGVAPDCEEFYNLPGAQDYPCVVCLRENCCVAATGCDLDCKECFFRPDGSACSPQVNLIGKCASEHCWAVCSMPGPSSSGSGSGSGSGSSGSGAGGSN